jgi:RNA polymerase-binding transcription factor DksA
MPKIEEHSAVTAREILEPGPEAPNVDPRWKKYFHRLNRLREYITQQRARKIADAHDGEPRYNVNPADRGTDEYDIGAALSLISSEQDALYEIEHALARIRDGTYGICEMTGKAIPSERLDAIPWARFAFEVEANLEKEQKARTPRHVL